MQTRRFPMSTPPAGHPPLTPAPSTARPAAYVSTAGREASKRNATFARPGVDAKRRDTDTRFTAGSRRRGPEHQPSLVRVGHESPAREKPGSVRTARHEHVPAAGWTWPGPFNLARSGSPGCTVPGALVAGVTPSPSDAGLEEEGLRRANRLGRLGLLLLGSRRRARSGRRLARPGRARVRIHLDAGLRVTSRRGDGAGIGHELLPPVSLASTRSRFRAASSSAWARRSA